MVSGGWCVQIPNLKPSAQWKANYGDPPRVLKNAEGQGFRSFFGV